MATPRSNHARRFYRCADRRRVEATILFDADQPTGAVYLGGYVAEFMLKAVVLESTPAKQQAVVLQELKKIGHNLPRLLEFYWQNGGSRPPEEVTRAFTLVDDLWSSGIRYDPKEVDPPEAERFLEALGTVYEWADGRI